MKWIRFLIFLLILTFFILYGTFVYAFFSPHQQIILDVNSVGEGTIEFVSLTVLLLGSLYLLKLILIKKKMVI